MRYRQTRRFGAARKGLGGSNLLRRALTDYDPGARTDEIQPGGPADCGRRRDSFSRALKNYTSLKRAKYCLVAEGCSPWSPRLTEAVAHGCVPVFLSPLLRPPYASVLDYSKFSIWLNEKDIPHIPSLLRRYDHASLFENLMRIRPLFAFCVDGGGEDGCGRGGSLGVPGDGLPFLVYEMFSRKVNTYSDTSSTLLTEGGYTSVDYACNAEDGSCSLSLNQERRCAMANRRACMCQREVMGYPRWEHHEPQGPQATYIATTHSPFLLHAPLASLRPQPGTADLPLRRRVGQSRRLSSTFLSYACFP